jgi:hypothetical protein
MSESLNDPFSTLFTLIDMAEASQEARFASFMREHICADEEWWQCKDQLPELSARVFVLVRKWLRDSLPAPLLADACTKIECAEAAVAELMTKGPEPELSGLPGPNYNEDGSRTLDRDGVPVISILQLKRYEKLTQLRTMGNRAREAVRRAETYRDYSSPSWVEWGRGIPAVGVEYRPADEQSPDDGPDRPPKRRISKEEAERLVTAAIENTPPHRHAKLTVRDLNKATGVSLGMFPKLDAWNNLQKAKAGSVNTVQATDFILAVLPDTSTDAVDPAEAVADAEVLAQLQMRAKTEEERSHYEKMPAGERWQLLELIKEQDADAFRDQRGKRNRSDCS